jgi:hypothetical protein
MEVFLERLLLELVAIAAQLAIVRLISWLRQRMQTSNAQEQVQPHLAAVA